MRFHSLAARSFFSSDTHFGHAKIIQHSQRPFSSIQEMDQTLIQNWNARISQQDKIFFLGDFAWKSEDRAVEILNQLHGQKILIAGNHDEPFLTKSKYVRFRSAWELIVPRLDLVVLDDQNKQLIVLDHYAMRTWNKSHYGSWHLHGHSHGKLEEISGKLSFDIGVDTHNFFPWSYAEVKEKMLLKEKI